MLYKLKQPLILASASPRRREILELLDLPFEVRPASSEAAPDGLPVRERALALARCKAEEVAAAYPSRVVVGADTMVALGERAFGKPRDAAQAQEMLLALQGRTHEVHTGVWICSPDGGDGFVESAQVTFYPMTQEDAAWYAATGEPMDKAGAYGIQGRGLRFIRGITGDFYTVMGLPGARLVRFLEKFGKL